MDRRVPAQRLGGADGLALVVITARDEASAYRVFDALVERFPGVEAPVPWPARPGQVALRVLTPTLTPASGPLPLSPSPLLPPSPGTPPSALSPSTPPLPPAGRPRPRPRTPRSASGDNSRDDHHSGKSDRHRQK